METSKQMEHSLLGEFQASKIPVNIPIPKISHLVTEFEENLNLFEVGPWGSCQYWTAWVTYQFATKLIKEIGFNNFLTLLRLPNGPWKSELEIIDLFKRDLESCLEDNEDLEIPEPFSIAAYAEVTKNNAWDLWSAYISFFNLYKLPPTRIGKLRARFNIGSSVPVRGPIFNQIAQSENFEIGISIAILEFLAPSAKEADWADYDT